MAEITGFTAERMLRIENSTIVHGLIDEEDNLILYTRGGDTINAGHIRGGTAQWIQDVAPVITEHQANLEILDDRYKAISKDAYELSQKADELEEDLSGVANTVRDNVDLLETIETAIANNKIKAEQAVKDSVVEYALAPDQNTAPVDGWDSTYPETTETLPYIWIRTIIERVNGAVMYTIPTPYTATPKDGEQGPAGPKGDKGDKGDTGSDGLPGSDGVGIVSTTITYAKSTSGTVTPTTGWGTTVPTSTPGQYLWTRTVWKYTDNTTETGYSVAMWGTAGAKGETGDTGVGVESITPYYRRVSDEDYDPILRTVPEPIVDVNEPIGGVLTDGPTTAIFVGSYIHRGDQAVPLAGQQTLFRERRDGLYDNVTQYVNGNPDPVFQSPLAGVTRNINGSMVSVVKRFPVSIATEPLWIGQHGSQLAQYKWGPGPFRALVFDTELSPEQRTAVTDWLMAGHYLDAPGTPIGVPELPGWNLTGTRFGVASIVDGDVVVDF